MKLKNNKNILFIAIIFMLSAALIICTVILAKRGSDYNAAYITVSNELNDAKDEISAIKGANDSYESQLDAERKEKERLQKENEGLRQQIEQLSQQKILQQKIIDSEMKKKAIMSVTKVCYLTFDDGPCENTLAILDILARYNVKATFFVKGSTKYPQYLPVIRDAGHAIGLHTYSHVYSSVYSSDQAYFTDLAQVSSVVEQYTGIRSNIVRFPGGSSNGVSEKFSKKIMTRLSTSVPAAGYAYFDWNVDSLDAEGKSAPEIVSAVLNQAVRKTGGICVLMHDIKTTTTEALPAIIEGLMAQGFYFDVLRYETFGFHHPINN